MVVESAVMGGRNGKSHRITGNCGKKHIVLSKMPKTPKMPKKSQKSKMPIVMIRYLKLTQF